MDDIDTVVAAGGGVVRVSDRAAARRAVRAASRAGWSTTVIDGRRAVTKASLLGEIARVLGFPAWFGGNWDALVDCLREVAPRDGAGVALVWNATRAADADPDVAGTLAEIVADLAGDGHRLCLIVRGWVSVG